MNQLLVEYIVEVMNLLGSMIERAMTCLTMQETREVEQVCLFLDALSHLWLYGISTLGRNNLLILLADDELGMTDDIVQ